ncbi:hypothetical protein [Stratiformator vulcanicus]|uniref:Uncharacterized protein n=1 Tax=Stratiformator vulcanicus TaxID=2527980 RepID=A0A517QVZ6_9PLAN|nr:hypothetical protein [Stratiformator vulcanicus]QDT35829.1 hypothetical protein Pan189_01820 [Stratiformator vulcanicus]
MRYTRATLIKKVQAYVGLPGVAMTHVDFQQRMRVGKNTVGRHFPEGGWAELLRLAWLEQIGRSDPQAGQRRSAPRAGAWSRPMIVEHLKRYAAETGEECPRQDDFCEWSGVGLTTLKRLAGREGWSGLKESAGLDPAWATPANTSYSLEQILDAYGEVREYLGGGRPTRSQLRRHCGISVTTIFASYPSMRALHFNWEQYQSTGAVPDPVLDPPEEKIEPKPSLFDFPPLPPLGPILPSEIKTWPTGSG